MSGRSIVIPQSGRAIIMNLVEQMLRAPDELALRYRERIVGMIAGVAIPVTSEDGSFDWNLEEWAVREPQGVTLVDEEDNVG